MKQHSSKQRFQRYLEEAQRRRAQPGIQPKHHSSRQEPYRLQRTFTKLLWEFWKLLQGQRALVCFALATLTVATVLKLAPVYSIKLVVGNVFEGKPLTFPFNMVLPAEPYALLTAIVTWVVVISVTATIIHVWGRWYATKATKLLQVAVRKRVFAHAVRLPLHRVYQLKSGGVASLLREDAGSTAELIFGMLYNPWRAIIQLVGSLVILALIDWKLLLGSLVLIPLVYFTHRTWISRIRPMYRDIRKQREAIDAQSTEAFGGMRVVRAFGRQRTETGRFTRSNHLMARQELIVWWFSRLIEVIWDILIPLASAALLAYGGYQVLRGNLEMDDLLLFLGYLAMLLEPMAVLANSATQFQNSLAGLDRVLDLLGEGQEMPPAEDAHYVQPDNVAGHLLLENVSFHYPGSSIEVLGEINLEVQPGQTVALVGPSGAGKTTLCNLIARFYDPTTGSIKLDGIDLRDIEVDSYRELLGIVEQDIFLFDGTIAENIGYGLRGSDMAAIEQAAKIANAHGFITELEHGYESIIGERGVKLSGGQRQRLAIARAVLADPRILILDEATSNLDTESERLIQESLITLMEDRTSFVIAHRLSTISHADWIVVLDDSRIIESGTHDELMSRSSRYRAMVELQMAGDRPEGAAR